LLYLETSVRSSGAGVKGRVPRGHNTIGARGM
jgi:hypothetical protein